MKKSFLLISIFFLVLLLIVKIEKITNIIYSPSFFPKETIHEVKHNRKIIVFPHQLSTTRLINNRIRMEQAIRKRLDQDADALPQRNPLIDIFNQISPQDAAKIIEHLNDEQIIELFSQIDTDIAVQILSHMNTQRASSITQKLLQTTEPSF